MKPRLFIGSSSEGKHLISLIQSSLESIVECVPWIDDGVFIPNKGTLEMLIRQTKISDFALLIATKDDITISPTRKTTRITIRDNVLFEQGLFLGASGIDRAFFLVEEGVNMPTDLNGISVFIFSKDEQKENYITNSLKNIKSRINTISGQSDLGFLPSTALAIGYYTGFVKNVCETIGKSKKIYFNNADVSLRDFRLKIIIPESLDDSGVNNFIEKYRIEHDLKEARPSSELNLHHRGYPFHFKVDPDSIDDGKPLLPHLHDIPTTLNTILECIRLYHPTTAIGNTAEQKYLEKRELSNFSKALYFLVKTRSIWTRDRVEIIENASI